MIRSKPTNFAKLSSSWPVQCQSNWELRLVLTLKRRGGGANWPAAKQKNYISITDWTIDLKPGCKFFFFELSKGLSKQIGPIWH